MKIGIISDTHDQTEICVRAIVILEKETPVVIHCGDFRKLSILKMFQNRRFEFKYVKGNHDSIKTYLDPGATVPADRVLEFTIGKLKFGAYHNTYDEGQRHSKVYESISSGKYDYFLYGHLHFFNVRFPTRELRTVAINPGGMYIDGLYSFAILDLGKREVELLTYYQGSFHSTLKVSLDKGNITYDKKGRHVKEYLRNLEDYFYNKPSLNKQVWSEGDREAWLNRRWNNEFGKIKLK